MKGRYGAGRALFLVLLAYLVSGWGATASEAEAGESRKMTLPLIVHIAMHDGMPVIDSEGVLASVHRANLALAPYDLGVRVSKIVLLPEGHSSIKGPKARVQLAKEVAMDGQIHVFFVDKVALFNPRHGDRRVSGMYWRYHGLRKQLKNREYLVVARDAPTTTLVHEIGHAMGLNHHRETTNLMCSCQRQPAARFTRLQGTRMRKGARRVIQRLERQ